MKQQEKTQRTQERILSAALVEFGEKGYEAASINIICAESQIPKGLLYHNFKSKDDLYLQCVKLCYNQMTEYLSSQELITHYRNTLAGLSLRDGITEKMALEYFTIFMEMFNGYFQSKADQGSDYKALMKAHEEKLSEILDMMLYGIAKQN